MSELCWDGTLGPVEANAGTGFWTALDREGRDVLPDRVFYANDETGEIWAYATRNGQPLMVNGEVMVMRTRLGAAAFRLVRRE
jgi:hypothetical protein